VDRTAPDVTANKSSTLAAAKSLKLRDEDGSPSNQFAQSTNSTGDG